MGRRGEKGFKPSATKCGEALGATTSTSLIINAREDEGGH